MPDSEDRIGATDDIVTFEHIADKLTEQKFRYVDPDPSVPIPHTVEDTCTLGSGISPRKAMQISLLFSSRVFPS